MTRRTLRIMLAAAGFGFAGPVFAAELPGYKASRLPIAVARQMLDANGNQRVILPSFINDNGIMGGIRLTWAVPAGPAAGLTQYPAGGGSGTTGLVQESGYLYDLKTKTFIAQTIANHIVSYVGDSYYIGKRLHSNGLRWQTLRCEIAGLVKRSNVDIYDNPSCVVIDNDYLDQTPNDTANAVPYWSSMYVSVNMLASAGFGYGATNRNASSAVLDFPDNIVQDGTGDTNIAYFSDGFSQPLNEAFASGLGLPANLNSSIARVFGFADGKDRSWAVVSGDGGPDQVYQVTYDGSGNFQLGSVSLNQQDASGEYAKVQAISKDGTIVTNLGHCKFLSGCSQPSLFDTPVALTSGASLLLSNRIFLGESLVDMRTSAPVEYDMQQIILDRFGDQVGSNPSYFFPQTPSFTGSFNVDISASESGKYLVLSARDNGGNYRVYLFEEQ